MTPPTKGLRPFVGAKDWQRSRQFYRALGFSETWVSEDDKLSLFQTGNGGGFYLQNYYVADWVNNSMLFLEVTDLDAWWEHLEGLKLAENFPEIRIRGPHETVPGLREIHLIDPAGILWHIGAFTPK